ncbi:ATP-binding protein [Actimicrobium sp. CCC2.4]|uniref:ATP-binding protein n=1 Tax=Actimicrobium sp. CCC2.4 TaxID=3048606 RepID=UPI002AC98812|nr:ATP-binding protein [Actimicrobium sp. CCC2.4]MEB0136401.1 ATP-binding protein [Actimicrobium sp. CCC2.4]WPX31220.1 ATP-binding protein [Actimicrobium sp. CCC2.4]
MTAGRTSIRRTMLVWLAAGLIVAMSLTALLLYRQARDEANHLFDFQMQQVASALPSRFLSLPEPGTGAVFDSVPAVVIQIWDPTGVRLYFSHDYTDLPQLAVLGFANIETRGEVWRVYSAQQGPTVVQIAQPLRVRSDMAARSALNTIAPLLLLVPFLGCLIWLAVRRGLAPIRGVVAQLASRDAGQLAPVSDAGLPDEIRPLTDAVNDLLARLARAAAIQQIFVDDAAHELRTPLTALTLQLDLARRATDQPSREAAFAALRAGLDRASRLVHQLLTLARQEPEAVAPRLSVVDLAAVARDAVADLAPRASQRGIDLGVADALPSRVAGDADALYILLNNILINALGATPDGGCIDVVVRQDGKHAVLTVQDSGPGIGSADLPRVFDRFYRGADAPVGGSGLGLAIVRRIADMYGARVVLANNPVTGGLLVRIEMALCRPDSDSVIPPGV